MGWRRGLLLLALACMCLLMTACGPDYPKCDNNEDCAESDQGKEESRLFCVNGLCQQCAADPDCGDVSMECNAGVCERIPGYCTSVDDCPGNQKCRDKRCGPECTSNDECGEGSTCEGGACVAKSECSADADCGAGEMCQNGMCVTDDRACTLDEILFGYDSSVLDDSARSVLQSNADCIKQRDMQVTVEGHADERGTSEYNIALGERRAVSAYKYLRTLGVSKDAMNTISYGEERPVRSCGEQGSESCYQANRRVAVTAR